MFLCFNFTTFPNYTVVLLRYLTAFSAPAPFNYRQVAHVSTLLIYGEQHTISRWYKKNLFSVLYTLETFIDYLQPVIRRFKIKWWALKKLACFRHNLVCFSLDYIGALITVTLIYIVLYVHGTLIGCFELGGGICFLEIKCRFLKILLNI